jgi:hypothetical protein
MGIAVSAIQSLIGTYPTGLFTAHQWYSDYPTDSDATFFGTGYFSSGDLPFGVIYEVHNTPTDLPLLFLESPKFARVMGHVVNNAKILGGYSSAVPVEEFIMDRPRGMLLFHEPSTTSIVVEMLEGSYCELWGLYLDIPLIGITQPTWNATSPGVTAYPPTVDGSVYTGLTDIGSFALDIGTIGVRWDLTIVPDRLGVVEGDPASLWDVGWMRWADDNAASDRIFLTAEHWENFDGAAARSTAVHYTLLPGVEATATVLHANAS